MLPAAAAAMFNSAPIAKLSSQQQPTAAQFSMIDDSLTDIRWLGSMDPHFPSLDHNRPAAGPSKGRKKLSYGRKQDGKSNSDNIRPPFSYAALIALAINSHPQNMLTLNSIYRWIEDNFPFFRMPEARAWKNSIRHNLSIKKNFFQKVYVDPPRRGNGAYWTLLPEGVEEVERCMKLLMTLRPPVIDPSSVYLHRGTSSSQIVRSRGKFIPTHDCETVPCGQEVEVQTSEKENQHGSVVLVHPLEQNYTPYPQAHPPSIQPFLPVAIESDKPGCSSHDTSNNSLFDLSSLTPLKDDSILHLSDLNNISLSPFFPYFSSSKSNYPLSRTPNKVRTSLSPFCTPLKPIGNNLEVDSGVYLSPSIKFSTPVKDLNDLIPGCTPIKHDTSGYFEPLRLAEFKHL